VTNVQEKTIMKRLRWVLASLALCVAAPQAWADNAIQSINSTQQAGAQVLRIELAEPLTAVPQGFVVQTPPRIALDFPSVGNSTGQNQFDVNQGNLRSVNMAQAGDRTRVVLNLRAPSTYKAQLDGKSLLVIIEPAANVAAAPAAADGPSAEPPGRSLDSASNGGTRGMIASPE